MFKTAECDVPGIALSEGWREWRPTQSWLADIVRATAAGSYAEIQSDAPNALGTHQNSISARISKAFGALLDDARPDLSISETMGLLLRFGDLGDVGGGYVIPRESRIVVFTPNWARMAGGLPLTTNEYLEFGVEPLGIPTVGRILPLHGQFDISQASNEHSELFLWSRKDTKQIFAHLSKQLPRRESSEPVEGSVRYYHAGYRRSRIRRDRWQVERPGEPFAVARTSSLPAHYFLCLTPAVSARRWFSIRAEEARKWLLLAERCCGTSNFIYSEKTNGIIRARLPDMLPYSWTTALLGCGSAVITTEKGWEIVISAEILPLFQVLLKASNMRMA